MKSEMTPFDQDTLTHCEDIISKTKESFIKCGRALSVIQKKKLYRADFKSFEEYCQGKWGWTRKRAYQLIGASEVVDSLPKKVSTNVESEAVARAVKKVPEAKREEVIQEAAKAGPVTARSIEEVYEAKKEPKAPKSGRETWGPKDRKACHTAFGKFVRTVDKAPFWNEIRGLVDSIAKELKK